MQDTIDQIVELGREHRAAIRDQTTLINMLKARVREYIGFGALKSNKGEKIDKGKASAAYKRLLADQEDPMFLLRVKHLIDPYEYIKASQDSLAKQMGKLVETLPIASWVEAQHGVGFPMIGKIIAAAGGDLSMYSTPAKLWKRFGEHVVDGQAPKPKRGQKLGFNPAYRAISFQLGDSLIKAGGTVEKGNLSPWKQVYEARKRFEIERAVATGKKVVPAAKIPDADLKLPFNKRKHMSEGHIHNRAVRYMRKKFLEALWQEWTKNYRDMELPAFITREAA